MSGEGMQTEFHAPGLRAFAKVLGPTQCMVLNIDGEKWIMLRQQLWDKVISGEFSVSTDQIDHHPV
jgi:hypothetical protein